MHGCQPTIHLRALPRHYDNTMETRFYFVLGDVLANLLAGVIVGAACAWIFGPAWNMWLAMLVGMPLGMILALPVAMALGALFGAMEVMLPVMVTAMTVSMVVPMMAAMGQLSLRTAVETGCWLAFASLGICYAANAVIKKRTPPWIS